MTLLPPTDSEALIQSNKKAEALEQQASELAHSVETLRQLTLTQSNERIEALEQKARDLAGFVEKTRQHILLQSDKKTKALEKKARDLADLVETLRTQTRLQSEKEIEALGEKARDLAQSVESVRKETRLQFETEITAMGQKAGELAVSVEAVRKMTLLQSDSDIAQLAESHDKTVAMNEALMLGSLRQHELTEAAENLNAQLRVEITGRKRVENTLRLARVQLSHHAGQLERLVTKRTAELTATNRRLNASILSIGRGKEKYRLLLGESQDMQRKLRKLTHQILTAQEEERKKISRELHDEVVQTLVGINVELSALIHGNSTGVQYLKDKITHTQRLVEKSVDAVHRFARELRPAVLDDLGLIPALHAFCQSLAERKKIRIKLTAFGGVEKMDGDKRTVLFRVAQEALTNVARHARATRVRLSIRKIPGAIRLEVADNGMAFIVKKILLAKNNKRLGLVGMKERVEMVGGNLTIESVSGKGTTVRAEIPFTSKKTKP